MQSRTIAILGAGRVGKTLGEGFVSHGHKVVLGSREPDRAELREWVELQGGNARSASREDAVRAADWVVLCVPGTVAEQTVRDLGADLFGDKVLIDVTNDMARSADGRTILPLGLEDSVTERIQRAVPNAKVVKAFNTTGVELMIDPPVECAPPTMPICGNDAQAKADVAELIREVGWEPVDYGGISWSPVLAAMTIGWVGYIRATGARRSAIKFVSA